LSFNRRYLSQIQAVDDNIKQEWPMIIKPTFTFLMTIITGLDSFGKGEQEKNIDWLNKLWFAIPKTRLRLVFTT
jgi:hypothetical protein